MVNIGETVNTGGHMVTRISARNGEPWQYECQDCPKRGDNAIFIVGVSGCPGRPESLNVLSVCAGGDSCEGHMDQSSPEWTAWKNSKSLPASSVPHYTCKATERGTRAASQFRDFAVRLGMPIKGWTLNTGTVFNVNAEGVRVADFDHEKGHYEVWVGQNGSITAVRAGE
jgi:hypothetical protein